MGKFLMATSALAFAGALAAGPAAAADQMSLGLGGYMEQWFGYANRDDDGAAGGWDTQSDSEVHFQGSLDSDMGLRYTVHVELEGNQNADRAAEIDESFVRVSGAFGQLEFGARDHAMVRMHYGISDVGIGLTSGDTQKWIPGAYLETAGHGGTAGGGDSVKLNYISPRVSGLQVGLSYAPDSSNESGVAGAPEGNDQASWGIAVNFEQPVAEGTFRLSVGHRSQSTADSATTVSDGRPRGNLPGRTASWFQTLNNNGNNYGNVRRAVSVFQTQDEATDDADTLPVYVIGDDSEGNRVPTATYATTLDEAQAAAEESWDLLRAQRVTYMSNADATYTNVGVGVGFGAYQFNVAYATSESDAMMVATRTQDTAGTTGNAADDHQYQVLVDDPSKDFDVWGVSVTYTDGPMALSLGHMAHETDAGGERTATMFSAQYTLAPGMTSRSSIFGVDDTTSLADVTGGNNEGTGFVTGIRLDF